MPHKSIYFVGSFISDCNGLHIYFRYKSTSGCNGVGTFEQVYLKNMGVAVGILFLGALQVDMLQSVLRPVASAAVSISGIKQLPVAMPLAPLDSSTSKT